MSSVPKCNNLMNRDNQQPRLLMSKVQRLGKARHPCRQKCRNDYIRWVDKRVGSIIGRNVGEYFIIQKTEMGSFSIYGNSI